MLQPYGIDISGDLLGLALIVFVFAAFGGSKNLWARVWAYANFTISGVTSATLLPEALRRTELDVFVYHSFWVVVAAGAVTMLVSEYKAEMERRMFQPAAETGSSTPGPAESSQESTVYKITTLE